MGYGRWGPLYCWLGCLAGRCTSLCLQAAHGGRAAHGRCTSYTMMRYTNWQPLPFTFTFNINHSTVSTGCLSQLYRLSVALYGKLIGESPAIWDHTVLPATQQRRWTCSTLTPASTWFIYPGGMEGWVNLGVNYIEEDPAAISTPCHQDGLSVCSQSPIQVQKPLDSDLTGSWTHLWLLDHESNVLSVMPSLWECKTKAQNIYCLSRSLTFSYSSNCNSAFLCVFVFPYKFIVLLI